MSQWGISTNALTEQAAFYQATGDKVANDTAPWAVTQYEASSLNCVLRQGGVRAAPLEADTRVATKHDGLGRIVLTGIVFLVRKGN